MWGDTAGPTAGLAQVPGSRGPVCLLGAQPLQDSSVSHMHPDPLGDTDRVQLVRMGWARAQLPCCRGQGRACMWPAAPTGQGSSGAYVPGGLASPRGGLGPCQAGRGWGLRPQDLTAHPGPSKDRVQALYGFPAGRGTWLRKPLSPHNGPLGICEGRGPRLVRSGPESDPDTICSTLVATPANWPS